MRRAGLGHRRIMDANAAGSLCEPDSVSFGQYYTMHLGVRALQMRAGEVQPRGITQPALLQLSSPPACELRLGLLSEILHISWKLIPPVSAPLYYCP